MTPEERRAEAVVADAMALFSSLATAAEVGVAIEKRRRGLDPSEQEAPWAARGYLREARRELLAYLVRLNASLSRAEDGRESHLASLVREGSNLMLLQRVERLLHGMHQRLLSLYPEVPETLVEEVRTLHGTAERMLNPEADESSLLLQEFVQQASMYCDDLQDVLL